MKAAVCFTGTGPILFLTSHASFEDETLLQKLEAKGIKKFIAYEVPVESVKERYGAHFNAIMGDLKQENDLRVLDYDGHHVFYQFSLKELGQPIVHESSLA